MQADRNLLDACQQALVREGFEAAALQGYDLRAIGTAAVRLAQAFLADTSDMLVHPLGFGRIPITEWALDKPRIAVHVWDSSAGLPLADDIHDHCYDFVSLCHTGALEHRLFQLDNVVGEGHRVQAVSYAAGSCDAATPPPMEGRDIAIREAGRRTVRAPSLFSQRSDVLHSARPLADLTVTVQFQSPCVKAEARVYRSDIVRQIQPDDRMKMTRARLVDALARAV